MRYLLCRIQRLNSSERHDSQLLLHTCALLKKLICEIILIGIKLFKNDARYKKSWK